jgi:DNA-binding transcriptional LysR family regulator
MLTMAQLRTFQAVARLRSFSRAALELNLTQPAVSAQIATLERTLGARFFDRLGRRVALTPSGEALLAATDEILARVDSLTQELRDLAGAQTGMLRIGASQVVGVYILPGLLAAFRRDHPGVELAVRVEPARRIGEMVADGELDVGLVGEGALGDDPRLERRPVRRDELLVIVPRGHVLAELPSVPAASLARLPFLLPRLDSASSRSLIEQLSAEGIRLESVLELGNVGAVKRAVEAGLGISVVSRFAVQRELDDGRLRAVRVAGLDLERRIALCWPRGRTPSPACAAFMELAAGAWPQPAEA